MLSHQYELLHLQYLEAFAAVEIAENLEIDCQKQRHKLQELEKKKGGHFDNREG